LVGLLGLQLLLLFLVFPLLFIHFENEQARQEIEAINGLDPTDELRPSPSFFDGLYWSLITPIKLDADHSWPKTSEGWTLVRVSDVTKVLTVGTAAGLFYDAIIWSKLQRLRAARSARYRRLEDEEIAILLDGDRPDRNGRS
jgi:hypothetical protein